MWQVCKFVTPHDPSLQNIEICFNLPRICHWKFQEDTLCLLGPWGVKATPCLHVVWKFQKTRWNSFCKWMILNAMLPKNGTWSFMD